MTDDPNIADTRIFIPIVNDGQNLAFLFNTSSVTEQKTELWECFLTQLIKLCIESAYEVIKAEETTYFQTFATEDGYSPSISNRNNDIFKTLKVTRQIFNRKYLCLV